MTKVNIADKFAKISEYWKPYIAAELILHLHDREWVFVPAGQGQFKRVQVEGGDMLPGGQQEILSGLTPGQQVVKDVLNLQATVEAQ